jgi:glyoxylase-like metal-dependent hydrolase (beta-lactamase superfamily II)
MLYEVRYTDYKDFGGLMYPSVAHAHQGNRFIVVADDAWEIRIADIKTNVDVPAPDVPDAVRGATIPAIRTEAQKLAEGVWLIGGGTHNSVAVEFTDFVAVVEAPLNDARSIAVIEEVARVAPNKPIRYVVNTHHHFDHSGGLRTYVSEGATIVTHLGNREFYEKIVFYPSPRTLQPDRLSHYPIPTGLITPDVFETLTQKYVISDGKRTLDVYPLQGLNHSANMLVAYLPTEKMLINADLYSPPAAGAQPPAAPSPAMTTLSNNIQRLKLDVAQHVPIHGRVGTHEEFVKIVGPPRN